MPSFSQDKAAGTAITDKNEWEPTAEWPFAYKEFSDAVIHLTSLQLVKTKVNIHVGNHYAWYENGGKRLEVKRGLITKVVFANGDVYYPIGDRLCQVIQEDTVNGNLTRLYMSHELDRPAFEEAAKRNNQSTMSLMDVPSFISSAANRVADNEGAIIFEQEPLPMRDKFFILYNGKVFEATESNILKNLSKEERTAYLNYTRRAEILSTNRKSMENVWVTFFDK